MDGLDDEVFEEAAAKAAEVIHDALYPFMSRSSGAAASGGPDQEPKTETEVAAAEKKRARASAAADAAKTLVRKAIGKKRRTTGAGL